MNKIYLAIIALLALTSCANTYEIKGTSNVSTLDGRMLYLKILKDNNFKSIDSCDVLHGQFHFQGNLDSVKMGNIFMDDEPVLPLVLESGASALPPPACCLLQKRTSPIPPPLDLRHGAPAPVRR